MTTFGEQCCIYTECVLSPLVTLLRKNKGTAGTSYVLGLPGFTLCCYYLVAGHSAPHLGWRDQLPPRSSHQGEDRRCAPCVGIWGSHQQFFFLLELNFSSRFRSQYKYWHFWIWILLKNVALYLTLVIGAGSAIQTQAYLYSRAILQKKIWNCSI